MYNAKPCSTQCSLLSSTIPTGLLEKARYSTTDTTADLASGFVQSLLASELRKAAHASQIFQAADCCDGRGGCGIGLALSEERT